MRTLGQYITESKDADKIKRLEERIQKHQEKIDKVEKLLNKKVEAFNKLLEKYKGEKEMLAIIPFDVFNNFKYITWKEQNELCKVLGVKHLIHPYNTFCGDMYYKKQAELRLKHGIEADTKYNDNKDKFDALENDAEYKALNRFYFNYFSKAEELINSIGEKEKEIKELKEKIITVSDEVKTHKAKKERNDNLFKEVPELEKFIEMVGEKQFEFYVEQNKKLEKAWNEFNKKQKELDKEYGSEWTARCNRKQDNGAGYEKYQTLNKTKPKQLVRTEEQIRRDVEYWKRGEKQLLAERVTTEFGKVKSTSLSIGADGNVNGTIVGDKKTAVIETIFAGGYNIQCLHTRLLVHEK